jgi:hypothetical protein
MRKSACRKVDSDLPVRDDRAWMELGRTIRELTGRAIEDLAPVDWETVAATLPATEFEAAVEYARQMRLAVTCSRASLTGDSKPRNKDEQLWIRIESRVKRRLEGLAQIAGLKLTEYVRRGVTELASQSIPTPDLGGSEEEKCEHKQK